MAIDGAPQPGGPEFGSTEPGVPLESQPGGFQGTSEFAAPPQPELEKGAEVETREKLNKLAKDLGFPESQRMSELHAQMAQAMAVVAELAAQYQELAEGVTGAFPLDPSGPAARARLGHQVQLAAIRLEADMIPGFLNDLYDIREDMYGMGKDFPGLFADVLPMIEEVYAAEKAKWAARKAANEPSDQKQD